MTESRDRSGDTPTISRQRIIERILRSRASVIGIRAGAGYGKTTLLRSLTSQTQWPGVYVGLDERDGDPSRLQNRLVDAIGAVGIQVPELTVAGAHGWDSARWMHEIAPGLLERLETARVVVALDGVEGVSSRESLEIIDYLVRYWPAGPKLVVAGRDLAGVRTSRRQANGDLLMVRAAELRLTTDDVVSALDDGENHRAAVEHLVELTAGWPVGVSASLAQWRATGRVSDRIGDVDQVLGAYIDEEVLAHLPEELGELLRLLAVLAPVRADDANVLLDRTDVGRQLADLWRLNLPLVDVSDPHGAAVAFTGVMQAHLRNAARVGAMDQLDDLLRRAIDLYDRRGEYEAALDLLLRLDDLPSLEERLFRWTQDAVLSGRHEQAKGWFERIPLRDVTTNAVLALSCAIAHGLDTTHRVVKHWLEIAETSGDTPLPDGSGTVGQAAARIRNILGDPPRPDSHGLYQGLAVSSPFRVGGLLARAWTGLVSSGPEAALVALRELGVAAEPFPLFEVARLELTALCLARTEQWEAGAPLLRAAHGLRIDAGLFAHPYSFGVDTVLAVYAMHFGDRRLAETTATEARRKIDELEGGVVARRAVAKAELARVELWLGRPHEARELLTEARSMCEAVQRADDLLEHIRRVRATVDAVGVGDSPLHSLSVAELRVLRHLPSHLTIAQIARELHVARSTVKSQTISIYRKLGARSREEAVSVARTLGML